MAPPVATFLSENDLSCKTIIPFCTHGGGGIERIEKDIAKYCAGATFLPGLEIYEDGGAGAKSQVAAWLRRIGVTIE